MADIIEEEMKDISMLSLHQKKVGVASVDVNKDYEASCNNRNPEEDEHKAMP